MPYDAYDFGEPKKTVSVYQSGAESPHMEVPVLRRVADDKWEVVGYIEIHSHAVLRDDRDLDDASFGITLRYNRKSPPKIVTIPVEAP